jgi:hypothetical protein
MYLLINNSSTKIIFLFLFFLDFKRKILPSDYDNVEEELHDHIIMFEMSDHLDLLMTKEEIFLHYLSMVFTCSAEVVFTISCKARTDTACSSTNTHDAKSGQQT